MAFIDRLDALCAEKGCTVTHLLKSIGIAASAGTKWRYNNITPHPSTIKKIAEYFGVPIAYFAEGAPTVIQDNHGIIGDNGSLTIQRETKDAQEEALLNIFRSLDVLGKAQLIAYAVSLSKGKE